MGIIIAAMASSLDRAASPNRNEAPLAEHVSSKREGIFAEEADVLHKRQRQEEPLTTAQTEVQLPPVAVNGGVDVSLPDLGSPPLPLAVTMSRLDKASTIHLAECLMKVTSTKGYRTARATHGVTEGTWYFEVTVEYLGETGHCRVGWATKQAHLHAPVGFDRHGYSYRDIEGTKQHKAERQTYGSPFAAGDVIGCLIHLPSKSSSAVEDGQLVPATQGDQLLPHSFIGFFKNGQYQGIAFEEILEGTYYPAVSMFTRPEQNRGVTLSLNFGPEFLYIPSGDSMELAADPCPLSEMILFNKKETLSSGP